MYLLTRCPEPKHFAYLKAGRVRTLILWVGTSILCVRLKGRSLAGMVVRTFDGGGFGFARTKLEGEATCVKCEFCVIRDE